MDLIAVAVPFFLLALLIELAVDRVRGTGHYRTNDAINSLSAGSGHLEYNDRLLHTALARRDLGFRSAESCAD
jgi:hypothetical protein